MSWSSCSKSCSGGRDCWHLPPSSGVGTSARAYPPRSDAKHRGCTTLTTAGYSVASSEPAAVPRGSERAAGPALVRRRGGRRVRPACRARPRRRQARLEGPAGRRSSRAGERRSVHRGHVAPKPLRGRDRGLSPRSTTSASSSRAHALDRRGARDPRRSRRSGRWSSATGSCSGSSRHGRSRGRDDARSAALISPRGDRAARHQPALARQGRPRRAAARPTFTRAG